MSSSYLKRIESLDCIVVDGGESPEILVVVCHGYGATKDDLAPLSGEWILGLGEQAAKYRFVFPNAPHSLAEMGMPFGRAWWPINMAKLAQLVEASEFDELHQHQPPGIDEARQMLSSLIIAGMNELSVAVPRLVIGGFSQGAMLTMDVALRGEIPRPNALIQFSGTMICQQQWEASITNLKPTSVFQSHGTIDPILPFSSAEAVRDLLMGNGIDVDFHSFLGPHTIDLDSIAKSGHLLRQVSDQ
ncbi:dienelactone hydrolase family protein [bacterium]|nr:dienelactone hydrolase family protein [bacterium]